MTQDKDKIKKQPETEEPDKDEEIPGTGDSEEEVDTEKTASLEEDVKAKIEAVEQEAKEAHDRLLRMSAEFENYKKRTAREMQGFRKFANESLIKEMLPVLDNLERAIDSSNNGGDSGHCIAEGVNMTLKETLRIFDKFGVKQIESVGQPFDPAFHEAVSQEETEEHPENTVSKELQKGYMLHDRLLRAAMVVVSKAKETGKDDEKDIGNT